MKQTEKKEILNFIQATLADGHPKTGTQLMELFAKHAGLQEYQGLQLNQSILLRKRDVELQFPAGTDAQWLAALLRAL